LLKQIIQGRFNKFGAGEGMAAFGNIHRAEFARPGVDILENIFMDGL
jgi:hypothetical protein